MEAQHLLNGTYKEFSKFATRNCYVINDQNNTEYGEGNENDSSIKVIKSGLCDYSDQMHYSCNRRYNIYRW